MRISDWSSDVCSSDLTSAARARRAFGPEIRLRIFWEQMARILFALGFFAVGFSSLGLMIAHLASLTLTAALSVPLLGRYYDLRLILSAPIGRRMATTLLSSGLSLDRKSTRLTSSH